MKLTNKHGVHRVIEHAIRHDGYTPGDSDITVTSLITPPQMRRLMKTHGADEDVMDRFYTLLGRGVHAQLEAAALAMRAEGANIEVETRLYTEVLGWKVGGQFDMYDADARALYDYKITSVWASEGKLEWEQQLNMLRLILARNDRPVESLGVLAFFRDWQRSKVGQQADYPPQPIQFIPVEVWPLDTAAGFMEGRVALHQADEPRPCTDEERWVKPEKFAVMKVGRKTAIKLFDKFDAAQKFIDESSDKGLLDVQHRPKQFGRCATYCPVAAHCPQLKAEQGERPF